MSLQEFYKKCVGRKIKWHAWVDRYEYFILKEITPDGNLKGTLYYKNGEVETISHYVIGDGVRNRPILNCWYFVDNQFNGKLPKWF